MIQMIHRFFTHIQVRLNTRLMSGERVGRARPLRANCFAVAGHMPGQIFDALQGREYQTASAASS